MPIYSFAYFTPTIVKTLGYDTVQTQLHSVPPFAAALGMCLILAYLTDRTDIRLPYVLFSSIVMITGLALLMTQVGKFSASYAGICLVCMGAYAAGPIVICWYLMNLQGHKERSIGSAWVISVGNCGGILAPFAFLSRDAPYYRPGYSANMAVTVVGIVSTICYALLILRRRHGSRNDGSGEKLHAPSL